MKQYVKPIMELKSLVAEQPTSSDELGNEVPIVSYPSNWIANDN